MEALGLDIGGSGIKGAPVDLATGTLLAPRQRFPTPDSAKPDEMAEVVGQIARHFQWNGPIGCGFPAVVRGGVAYTAANIDRTWIGTNVEKLFQKTTGCGSVRVLNDADAAGLAEMEFGAGKGREKGVIIMITIGTGLGTAIFVDGKLLPNTELGHIEIRGKDAERRASDAARQRKGWSLEEWAPRFNEYLTRLEALLWPDVFILGGGASKEFDEILPFIKTRAEIIPAKFLNLAGIVGAALAVKQ
jgi:polyphosphate glucokinase